jgi:hypothetical protein
VIDPVAIPRADDPTWPVRTAALAEFVRQSPRRTDAIVSWCQSNGAGGTMARNLLASLSLRGVVRFRDDVRAWVGA